ncbi:MAG: DUF6134 family protein [Gammaproteobacteria bacterium]|nr:DUF6134 family protein [Gammaproteobacteria bacterium]
MSLLQRYFLKILLFIGLPVLAGLSMQAIASTEKNWRFKVFLDDKEIGTHEVRVVPYEDLKQVTVDANFKVKFLFITAYQYQHHTEEVWQGSCLKYINAKTDDNGDDLFIRKVSNGNDFVVETHSGRQNLGDCVRTFAYWDPELLRADKLLNTQTGEYESVQIIDLGKNQIEINEKMVESLHYRLKAGEKVVDLWYTPDMNWLALKSTTEDGYLISYYPETMVF